MARMRQLDSFGQELPQGEGQGVIGGGEQEGATPGMNRNLPPPGLSMESDPHGLPGYAPGREAEGPRDRSAKLRPAGGKPTPSRPSLPTPMSGSVSEGVMPFEPMGELDMLGGDTLGGLGASGEGGYSAKLRGGLMGSQGGLQGGGLGLPFDPVADEQSDPIALLMQLLNGGQGGGL